VTASAFSLLSPGVQAAVNRLRWTELRPIQRDAVHAVLETHSDIIIAAPTAGGKTEAAFLPIISRHSLDPGLVTIYVSPLKALINDQWNRLDGLCSDLGIPVRRWHGDVPATEKKSFREHPSGLVLITPESLESNFVNYGRSLERIYSRTSFVVIDELHVFIDGVRGMHLRSLISRLCAAAKCKPRLVGLSATLGENITLAKTFLRPDDPEGVRIVGDVSKQRDIRIGVRAYLERPRLSPGEKLVRRLTPSEAGVVANMLLADAWKSESPLAQLGPGLGLPPPPETVLPRDAIDDIADEVAASFQDGKNLIFGNSRRTLEELADLLHEKARAGNWRHDPFHVHHGSLTKSVREDVERALKESPLPTTALCTSTLELGIDIGDVRTVGQIDPPWSVAAATQRLGRSGRRGDPSRMRLYARDETPRTDSTLTDLLFPRLLRTIAVVQLMLGKWVESKERERMHVSTLVHQVLSVLRQTGGLPAASLFNQLCLSGAFRAISQSFFAKLLRGLAAAGLVEQVPTGEIILGLKGERICDEHDFYAAFASNELYTVRSNDEVIGEMPADSVPPEEQSFILNGRRWKVKQVSGPEKTVWVVATRERVPPLFVGDGGDVDARIYQVMQGILNGEDLPPYLDAPARQLLSAARHAARESGAASLGVVTTDESTLWFPWTGTKEFRTIRLMLSCEGVAHEYDELSVSIKRHARSEFIALLRRLRQTQLTSRDLAARMDVKTFDKFDELLPVEILDEINASDRINLLGAMEVIVRTLDALEPELRNGAGQADRG